MHAKIPVHPKEPLREYGGDSIRGKRKVRRPFKAGRPLHLVFRSSRACGAWSFLQRRNKAVLRNLFEREAKERGLKVLQFRNFGQHLQILARFPDRASLRAFLRVFTQKVMFLITGARKGCPKGRFFDAIAYSRVLDDARDLRLLIALLLRPNLPAMGFGRVAAPASWKPEVP
jgi:hypothetical protein